MIPLALFALSCASGRAPVPDVRLGNVRPVQINAAAQADWARVDDPPGLSPRFGHDPHEPVGPWAVFADGPGISVLDQVQSRIVRYDVDGTLIGTVPIPAPATFDAVATGQGYGLLAWTPGADAHWSAQSVSTAGALQSDVRMNLDPPTAVLFDSASGHLLVEDRHVDTVDVTTGERFPGRPSGTGWYVSAHKDDLRHVTLTWSSADRAEQHAVRLVIDRPLSNLVALDPLGDDVVVGLFLMENTTDPALANPVVRVVRVDRTGHLQEEFELPAGEGLDPNRPLALLPDGTVFHLLPTPAGVALNRVRL